MSLENIGRNIVAIWHLALSGPRTRKILNEVKPDLVIGCGGYVSGPVVLSGLFPHLPSEGSSKRNMQFSPP